MSTYESDPNKWTGTLNGNITSPEGSISTNKGDAVGKRYGAKSLGSVGGRVKGEGVFNEAVIEITKEEQAAAADVLVRIPAYSQITEIWAEVTEAFGTGDTLDIHLDGNDINNAVIPASALGIFPITVTTTLADLQVGSSAEDLTLDLALLDDTTAVVGEMKVTVRYITM